jgi:hypothetical protein
MRLSTKSKQGNTMKKNIILFAILLFGGLVAPMSAQSVSTHVVINEIDTNPPGDDSKSINEWIELYNPTDSTIDIGGWKIVSTNALKKTLTIPLGTVIESGKFLTYSYQTLWFADSSELVELQDKNGILVDKTPLVSDLQNDLNSWQRIYDGYDLDSSDDWKFATSTAVSSNGKLPSVEAQEPISISVSSDKSSYLSGESSEIHGHVSKEVFITAPYFHTEEILVKISGPKYDKTITLYPDLNLNYKTSITLSPVLGIDQGVYSVLVSYAGATSQTSFIVGNEVIVSDIQEDGILNLITDRSQYLPGDTVSITGLTTKTIPYEGLKFTIQDPNGKLVSTGNLYPTNGKFSTSVFLTTVNPIYGTYRIIGEYADQSTHAFFDVLQDIKEDKSISLWTDKESYDLGQTVTINGRLNNVWVGSLDLEIVQTKNTALDSSSLGGGNSGFKILDIIRTAGDGSFSYSFKIPENDVRLGDYKISVSKEVGLASKIIHVVTDSDTYVVTTESLSLSTDKMIYDLGDTMTIKGFIANPVSRSSFEASPVKISMSHKDGSPLNIVALPSGAKTRQHDGLTIAYEFTAIPDSSGRFSVQAGIVQTVFTEGTYTIKAEYQGLTKITTVGIVNPLKLLDGTFLVLDKQVYGLGETVHLTGLLPPTGDSSVVITIIKPDGNTINSGVVVDNQRFFWSWITPISEKPAVIKSEDRSLSTSNFGIYKMTVSTASSGKDIFFKVSSDPENDSLSLTPLYVSTEKSLYKAGEKLKVIGSVIAREHGSEGLVVPERVTISVLDGKFPYKQIHQAFVYPDQGGNFKSLFELPITIFHEGEYKVKALYSTKQSESTFSIANDFTFGSDDDLSLLLVTDKSEYYPGDTVTVTGKPNKLIYLEKFDVSVIKKTENEITCGSFYCGVHSGPITSIRPSPSGSFSYQIQLSDSESSFGSYEVTVDAGFEAKSLKFDVVQRPVVLKPETPTTIIEKVNGISDNEISVTVSQKTIKNKQFAPRVISGTLLVPLRDDQSNVNLRVTTESGICVIGSDDGCLVKESTRDSGKIYRVVQVDGLGLNVRYSGPDVRLEKFEILPQSSTAFLPNSNWHVDIIKDDQVSKFYSKITYKILDSSKY